MEKKQIIDIHGRSWNNDVWVTDCAKMSNDLGIPLFMVEYADCQPQISKLCPAQTLEEIHDILVTSPTDSQEAFYAQIRWDEIAKHMLYECNSYEQAIAIFESARPHSAPQLEAITKASTLFFLNRPAQDRQWNIPEYKLREALGQPIIQCPAQNAREAKAIFLDQNSTPLEKDIALARWKQLFHEIDFFDEAKKAQRQHSNEFDGSSRHIDDRTRILRCAYQNQTPPDIGSHLSFIYRYKIFYKTHQSDGFEIKY